MWNERYAESGYAYGTEPNEHLAEYMNLLPKGPILSLAEGEGRNAVALARAGYDVLGVDQSTVGLEKAQRLAQQYGVSIRTECADLSKYVIVPEAWSGIISIFCHLPSELRRTVLAACVAGLTPGGVFILESYTPAQLELKTGGPQSPDLLPTLDSLRQDLRGLDLLVARELQRVIHEGKYHNGLSSVVQVVGRKPL
jgi:cyclopropane fatty-acyl-phospholipid synthase-like methyltransferase